MEPEDRARREMFVPSQAALDVSHRKRQAIERQIRGCAERDQRTAVGDEADQALDALIADPAAARVTERKSPSPNQRPISRRMRRRPARIMARATN